MSEAELVKRLERLERENWRLKRIGLVALAAIGAVLLMGLAAPVPQTIRARRFVLEDAQGKTVGELGVFHDQEGTGPGLRLFDASGGTVVRLDEALGGRLWMGDTKNYIGISPAIGITASQGNEGTWSIGAELTGLGMLFSSPHSNKQIMLSMDYPGIGTGTGPGLAVVDGNNHLLLLTGHRGSEVFVSDAAGFTTEIGNTNLTTLLTGETHHTSAASIVMERNDKENTVIWHAPR